METKKYAEIQKLTAIWGAKNRYYWGFGTLLVPVLLSCRGISFSNDDSPYYRSRQDR